MVRCNQVRQDVNEVFAAGERIDVGTRGYPPTVRFVAEWSDSLN
jgi:hypothetical protein